MTAAAIAATCRDHWVRVVAVLTRQTGDVGLAEDATQDAVEAALRVWPRDGLPDHPDAWLTTAARHKLIDRLRRERRSAERLAVLARFDEGSATVSDAENGLDDQLALVLLCCHPALAPESQVALTLRAVAGLAPGEIARAFLMETRALQQRLVRAKRKIALAGIPFRLPLPEQLPARITAALAVAYLVFNEGYAATAGDRLLRIDLAEEGIRLARLLVRLVPEDPEALGLLALLQLHHARRHARVDAAGELVPLEEQDRSRWDSAAIADGLGVLERALRLRHPGPYQLQATIAAQHALARRAEDTPWLQITALYSELLRVQPSPMVELNRAVAVGMAYGSDAGLTLLERLEHSGQLSGHHLLPATRADLLRRAGQVTAAVDAYRLALSLAANGAERRYLQRRIAELTAS